MKEEMKDEMNNPRKIRWNISMAMSCVFKALWKSNLKIKKTKNYEIAMERLKDLFKLTQSQVWILCMACEHYVECDDSTSLSDISEALNVPAMAIMNWKKDMEKMAEDGFFEWRRNHKDVMPVSELCDALYSNIEFIPQRRKEIDEIDFLKYFADRYESRRSEDMSDRMIARELLRYEKKNENLAMIKRVKAEIENAASRFFLYDVASDVIVGGLSSLNETISDLFDGGKRYTVATQMMEETHELFKKGLIEFERKGNLTDAAITLTDKGKKLIFAEKAFLFEEKINEKDLIKVGDIKEKHPFYSPENQKEIDRLKNALQEEKLQGIQKRLKEDGLPVGVAVLLYGAPGTGKTESVMQIAKETGRSIVHVDIAEAKSAWFGESEKRIKKIFTSYKNACEISKKKGEPMPILLFNEADALIAKRKENTSGNCAQTENAIQNIILEELENLQGIFIATTNMANNMDTAFERRFLFKIKFENPSTEAKTSIWMNKLSWLNKDQAIQFAKDYDFSGGQIDNIVRKVAMNEVITGARPDISEIHDMCKTEKIENPNGSKRMGFCL